MYISVSGVLLPGMELNSLVWHWSRKHVLTPHKPSYALIPSWLNSPDPLPPSPKEPMFTDIAFAATQQLVEYPMI